MFFIIKDNDILYRSHTESPRSGSIHPVHPMLHPEHVHIHKYGIRVSVSVAHLPCTWPSPPYDPGFPMI